MLKTIINITIFSLALAFLSATPALAGCGEDSCNTCCAQKGGILYGDSSAGRYVCNDGDYSVCYSTIHAVMDMQKFEGCCIWKGGVLKVLPEGIVLCRNGSYSELCSIKYNDY